MSRSGVDGEGMDVLDGNMVDVKCVVGAGDSGIVELVCMGNGVYGCEESSGV